MMAPSPFRRRKSAKTVRNLLVGGAVAAAAAAAALLKRDKVARLLPSRTGEPEPMTPVPPQPSNYDAPGPVANTATPIPAPDPHGEPPATIDESAEEAAAAAEAGAIGGTSSDYAGPELGEAADEAERPLAEAGEGESEGQEQADQPQSAERPEPVVSEEPGESPGGGGISGRPFSGLDQKEDGEGDPSTWSGRSGDA